MKFERKEKTMINRIKQVYKDHPIDKEKIRRAVIQKGKRSNYKVRLKPWFLYLVYAIFVLVGCFSGLAISKEVKAYNEALTFFDKYNLPTDGLTRNDIKNVYRDISTGRFTYKKTALVIEKSIGGHEIFQESPTAEDLKNLWEYRNNNLQYISKPKDTPYRFEAKNEV